MITVRPKGPLHLVVQHRHPAHEPDMQISASGSPTRPHAGFVTPTVADLSFVGKMADGDLVRSPPIPA